MILNRFGNKRAIAQNIIKHFPKHKTYIEPFFGAGGIFFNKPKAEYNLLNDLDSEIFNLYRVLRLRPQKFKKELNLIPITEDLLKYWNNKFWEGNKPKDCLLRAVRFIFLSNFTFMGDKHTLRAESAQGFKKIILNRIEPTLEFLGDTIILKKDYKKFLKSISVKNAKECFIYCDPLYIGTKMYNNNKWEVTDFTELLDFLIAFGIRFAVSEFDNEEVIIEAKKRCLNIIKIGERKNLKNRRNEVLITNYSNRDLFNNN